MSATANTRRPLIKNVGVWLTSSDCPNAIDFLTLASVPAAAAQEAIFSASRPAAAASSFSLSSALASAMLPWLSKMASRYFQRSEEHTSELQSRLHLVCRLLLEKKKNKKINNTHS